MIEEVGGDPGESRATPTTAAGDDGAEIKQAGGGDTLTANVSNRKSISLFVCLFICFVCLLCELSVLQNVCCNGCAL